MATGDVTILWVTGLGVSPPDPPENFFTELEEPRFVRDKGEPCEAHVRHRGGRLCTDLAAAAYRGAKKTSQKEAGRTGNDRERREVTKGRAFTRIPKAKPV